MLTILTDTRMTCSRSVTTLCVQHVKENKENETWHALYFRNKCHLPGHPRKGHTGLMRCVRQRPMPGLSGAPCQGTTPVKASQRRASTSLQRIDYGRRGAARFELPA